MQSITTKYLLLNADGILVGEDHDGPMAVERARALAEAGDPEMLDSYSVVRADDNDDEYCIGFDA